MPKARGSDVDEALDELAEVRFADTDSTEGWLVFDEGDYDYDALETWNTREHRAACNKILHS